MNEARAPRRFDLDSANGRGPIGALLRPVSWLYGAGRWTHRAIYRAGLKRRRRLPRPVICIGNLTVGGAGKTPLLIHLVNRAIGEGLRPVVLSRGYGADPPADPPRVISDGKRVLFGADAAGDEPVVIARACKGAPVVIGVDRFEAGEVAFEAFDPDLFLLDDGFQHEPLARDADLVLWDARDLPSKMRLLPAGRLREGLGALRRATAVIVTHGEYLEDSAREERMRRVLIELKRAAPAAPVFEARSALTTVRRIAEARRDSLEDPIDEIAGRRALLVSGLARPEGFETLVRRAGIDVVGHLAFGDHHRYDAASMAAIARAAEEARAERVLTTDKDAVKLEPSSAQGPRIDAVRLEMSIAEPERWDPFWRELTERARARIRA
jgi:tetraacyldisaccharide 4'-kinase